MRISRIYYNGALIPHEQISFPLETSHYLVNVLRLKVGSEIIIFNGKGEEHSAILVAIQKKEAIVKVGPALPAVNESSLKIHLVQGISRGEKMDIVIQKAVELGVHQITPVVTEFCNVKLSEGRFEKKHSHWQKIIISACEQSGRAFVPHLSPIVDFKEWVMASHCKLKLFCDPVAANTIRNLPLEDEVLVLVGPEGGLSASEIALARKQHFHGMSLGPRILRTETAALAALAILQSHFGDMS